MMKKLLWSGLILLLTLLPAASSFAATQAPQEERKPEQVSPQLAALVGKRVVVELKNGRRMSGRLFWDDGIIYHFDGKVVKQERAPETFYVKQMDGLWKCGERENLTPSEVVSIKKRSGFSGKVKDVGMVSATIALAPAIIVSSMLGYQGCK